MKYPRILSAIRSARWAITPPALQSITDTLGAHLRGNLAVRMRASDWDGDRPLDEGTEKPEVEVVPQVGPAVIEVYGIIGKHLSSMESECGGCDLDCLAEAIDMALATPQITAILLDFDSPGGTVTGVHELAAKIRAADQIKPIYAYTSAQCCSAAYWLASAARAVYCAPSADVGSIGVYVALIDDSEWWKKEGYKLELIKAGKFKAMGISGQPLSDDERALIQADVDTIYSMFTGDIRQRRTVDDSTMQGQTFLGQAAVSVSLADALYSDRISCLRAIATVG